ncbi:MAG: hypothetical protein ABR881_20130 [Candidatus Sulfotelmatobacter sp.]
MTRMKTFAIVTLGALVVCVLPWLLLLSGDAARVGGNRLFPWVMAFFFFLPLYPLYRLIKQWPRLRVGIIVIAANALLCVVLAFLLYVFHLDNVWIDRMFDVSEVLSLSGCLLLVWQGLRLHRQ